MSSLHVCKHAAQSYAADGRGAHQLLLIKDQIGGTVLTKIERVVEPFFEPRVHNKGAVCIILSDQYMARIALAMVNGSPLSYGTITG